MVVYSLLVFIHILLFVFWLGTDIGVYLAAKISERSDLSVETRATVLQLGMVLDRLPRSALVLIVPTGLQLAVLSGHVAVPAVVLPVTWSLSLVWLAVLWWGFLNPQTPAEQRAMLLNFAMSALMAAVLLGFTAYLFVIDNAPMWLKLKVLLVGVIFLAAVALDIRFKPAVAAFTAIIEQGATPEKDARYSQEIGPVYPIVLLIYALVFIAAYLGVTKVVA